MGAEPSKPLQASRCRRSTDNTREGLPPNLRHQRSSRSGRRCQKRQKPPRATCANRRPGERAWHKAENQATHQRHSKPNKHSSTAGAGRATGARMVAELPKGNLRQDTPRKTAGAAGGGTEATPVIGSTIAYPAPSRRRERRHSSAAPEKTYTHTQGQPVRRSAAKTHKTSNRRQGRHFRFFLGGQRRLGERSEPN